METFLIRALQLIMSLSLLVIVHEGGHFLFARLFKTRVEKFCLFFDPWFTLFKTIPNTVFFEILCFKKKKANKTETAG